MFKRIDCVLVKVKNLESSARFYAEVLGLKRIWTDPERNMIGFRLLRSKSEIVLHANPDLEGCDPHYLVDDVMDAYEALKARGVTFVQLPFDIRCGKCAVMLDPDGNKLSILDLTSVPALKAES